MKTLNILNGDSLKYYFNKYYKNYDESVISFNECLVDGELHEDIFSKEFFHIRDKFITKYFNISEEIYQNKSIKELEPLLNGDYEKINLWFDFDMFCQINMLAILAYLNFSRFKGLVTVNIIKQNFSRYKTVDEIIEEKIEMELFDNFYNLYINVLIEKDFKRIDSNEYINIFKQLPSLKEGIRLYMDYKLPNNQIKAFINKRRNKGREVILADLINNLNNYGLGDTQYMKILDEMGIK